MFDPISLLRAFRANRESWIVVESTNTLPQNGTGRTRYGPEDDISTGKFF